MDFSREQKMFARREIQLPLFRRRKHTSNKYVLYILNMIVLRGPTRDKINRSIHTFREQICKQGQENLLEIGFKFITKRQIKIHIFSVIDKFYRKSSGGPSQMWLQRKCKILATIILAFFLHCSF